jgi:predicted RNase H-like nuclease
MIAVGLDGCCGGWVVVTLNATSAPSITAISSIEVLRDIVFDRAAIDIPIGLPDCGNRDCDEAARKYLGEHASRVFVGSKRRFLASAPFNNSSFSAENERLKRDGKPGVSLQLWNILSKVQEVDVALCSDPTLCIRLRETHPELVFKRLNRLRSVARKKSVDGRQERLALLREAGLALGTPSDVGSARRCD